MKTVAKEWINIALIVKPRKLFNKFDYFKFTQFAGRTDFTHQRQEYQENFTGLEFISVIY